LIRIAAFLTVLFTLSALAENKPPRFEITPFAGYRLGGTFEDDETRDELKLEDSSSFGMSLSMQAEANTQYELTYSHQATDIDVSDVLPGASDLDIDLDYLQIGGTYLWDGNVARPFLVATIGIAHLDPDASDLDAETYFAFSVGGGWKVFPTRRLGLRLEGRFYGTVLESDSAVFCRSGPEGTGCLLRTSGELLWQWEMFAGVSFRF
jgi:hypothetical protein